MTLELNLQRGLVGHWTMDDSDTSGGTIFDKSAYGNNGNVSDPTSNYFGPNASGYWRDDIEQLGSVDGFNDVGKADATANTSYEDIFTGQFTTGNFANSGSGYYVYLAFAAKWNELPGGNGPGETVIREPTPDPNKYQLYIYRNDGQNYRDEYFRMFYRDNNDTAVARIADPFVWTQDDEGPNARIIESGGSRTVQPYTKGIIGDGHTFDGSGTIDGTVEGDNIEVPESITRTDNYPNGTTYSIWLNVDTDAVDRMSLFRGNGTIRHIEIFSEGKYFRTEAAEENGYSFGTGYFPDNVRGEWSHFAIVFAEDEPDRPVRWYQNGELFHTGDMTSGDNPDTEYFSFGSIGQSTGNTDYTYAKSFDGKIDDVRIYNRKLSESEISALYNMRSQRNANI